jgi:hypothetical protein
MFCPDLAKHSALEQGLARELRDALELDEACPEEMN